MSPPGARRAPTPQCPIRPGDPCSLCQPGVTGPQDCGLVYLVMDDPEMREELAGRRRRAADRRRTARSTPG
ncbi:DUF6767 domain-containing protein [Ornithinimicrobium flavum]|uniref:DUF6767 domain-containing protein n=1 Tax=Ornithinimicrobium flavum TaxID=1288636 RepID=UPI00106FFEBA